LKLPPDIVTGFDYDGQEWGMMALANDADVVDIVYQW